MTLFIPSVLVDEKHDVFTDKTRMFLERNGESITVYPDEPSMKEQKKKARELSRHGDFLVGWSSGANIAFELFEEEPEKYSGVLLLEFILDWYNNPIDQILMSIPMEFLPKTAKRKIGSNKYIIKSLLDSMIETGVDEKDYENMMKALKGQGGEWLVDSVLSIKKETIFKDYTSRVRKIDEEFSDKIYGLCVTKPTKKYGRKLGIKNYHELDGNHMIGYGPTAQEIHGKILEILK